MSFQNFHFRIATKVVNIFYSKKLICVDILNHSGSSQSRKANFETATRRFQRKNGTNAWLQSVGLYRSVEKRIVCLAGMS
jgi:hypothetical protein